MLGKLQVVRRTSDSTRNGDRRSGWRGNQGSKNLLIVKRQKPTPPRQTSQISIWKQLKALAGIY
jgi:hypothetical protein